jgi:predicted PhzF superfamily epimerase YddE/YHI9
MRQWTIDAFASGPFKGNPACVVEPFEAWPDPLWMQALAMENNQAETAYLLQTEDPTRFGLRWFTPTQEVELCGHATLAAGHALSAELGVDGGAFRFDTLSGELSVTAHAARYEMDFPSDPPRRTDRSGGAAGRRPEPDPRGMGRAIPGWPCWRTKALCARRSRTSPPCTPSPARRPAGGGNLIIASEAEAGRPYDVVSRFFAPGSGIAEDPATGSAHCF